MRGLTDAERRLLEECSLDGCDATPPMSRAEYMVAKRLEARGLLRSSICSCGCNDWVDDITTLGRHVLELDAMARGLLGVRS